MSVVRLTSRRIGKVWGRRDLLPPFGSIAANAEPIGEIWFEDPRGGDAALMVKYLFTSEKLSIQVHPDDKAAQTRGLPRGKDEAWIIIEADPGATIGIGLKARVAKEELRAAARDGRIEEMLDWRPAHRGDFYYSPAGTVHALGAGLKLIEIQQNVDLTYRLYDYGRPRELHLDAGLAVANPCPYHSPFEPRDIADGRRLLAEGKFVIERWSGARSGMLAGRNDRPIWLIPVAGTAMADAKRLEAGEVWLIEDDVPLVTDANCDLLVAYADDHVDSMLLRSPSG